MVNQTLTASRLRLPAWLLIISIIPFIAIPITAAANFISAGIGPFVTITPQQMAVIRNAWILLGIFGFAAQLLGTIGLALTANAVKATAARPLAWLTLIAAVSNVVIHAIFAYLRLSVVSFTEANLGMVSNYVLSSTLIYIGYLTGLLMTCAISVGLYVNGWLRRAGLVISILSGILFLMALVPSISNSIPPLVFFLLWVPLGIGLLRRRDN